MCASLLQCVCAARSIPVLCVPQSVRDAKSEAGRRVSNKFGSTYWGALVCSLIFFVSLSLSLCLYFSSSLLPLLRSDAQHTVRPFLQKTLVSLRDNEHCCANICARFSCSHNGTSTTMAL